ncbi:MAG: hypothetical protein ABL908_05425 [Hyphomicrobium sp.]
MRSKGMSSVWRWALPLIVGLTPSIGAAAPLAKEACDALKAEQVSLTSSGLRADLARGAAWGKVNLAAERIKKVARLIEVDEQILFRCASPAPPEADTTAEAKPKPKPKAQAQKAAEKAVEKSGGKPAEAAASGPGNKLAPQSAKAADDAPAKPTKAEIAAEKKRAAAEARAKGQSGNQAQAQIKDQAQIKAQAKSKIKANSKADDAFVPPDGSISTLQPPAVAAPPKPQ